MPIARFQMPDGRIGRFEVPDGTTPEQAQVLIQESMATEQPKTSPVKIGKEAFTDTLRQTLQEAPWGVRNIAGAGTALSNLWEGAKQLVGKGDQQAIEANKIIEQESPIGSIAGNVAATAIPFSAVGNSLRAAGALGAGFGALQPVQGEQSLENIAKGKAINTAIGGALSAGGQAVANRAGDWMAKKTAGLAAQKSRNAPIDATIKEALDAGYVLPPGQVKPTFLNRQLESAGGKIATQQMASAKNQAVTDSLARKAAGLADDAPITPETLKAARDVIKQPYQEIASLGLQPKLNALDAARAQANAAWREYSRQGTRSALNDYAKFKAAATNIEKEIEGGISNVGKDSAAELFKNANELTNMAGKQYADYVRYANIAEKLKNGSAPMWSKDKIARLTERMQEQKALVDELQSQAVTVRKRAAELAGSDNSEYAQGLIKKFRDARVALAKNHDVESALIEGGGTVDARAVGRMFQRGDKMTGELATIGKFANNFKKDVQPGSVMGTPDAHNLKTMLSMLMGGGGGAVLGPAGIALGAIPMAAGPIARSAMFSKPAQQGLLNSYSVGMLPRATSGLLQNSAVGATALGLPALSQ